MAWGNDPDTQHDGDGPLGLHLMTLVLGAAIGVGAALLLAHPGGRSLRGRLLTAVGDWKSSAAEALARGRERVVSAVENDYGVSPNSDPHSPGHGVRSA
jgi:hypothetical protein